MTRSTEAWPGAGISRRDWLRLSSAGVVGYSMSGWLETLADVAAKDPKRKRACILLWMAGGPSQTDTFDLKPGHPNGGPFKEIATTAPGVRISEHFPKLAKMGKHLALLRSMSTKESDHERATYYLRTGYVPVGALQFPPLGSLVSKELGKDDSALPNFVSIAPTNFVNSGSYSPGFLGPRHAPLIVGSRFFGGNYLQALKVEDLEPPSGVQDKQRDARISLLEEMERDFISRHPDTTPRSHQAAYERAVRLMRTSAAKAYKLEDEKDDLRKKYGQNLFGQGCLLARRLVERGVPFVEVTLGYQQDAQSGWDTHDNNFNQVKKLSGTLDAAWSTLLADLKDRGLLETTLVVWMGEFGRTPKINGQNGRDHFARAWSTVLSGGGIKGGQVVGKTSADGMDVKERPISCPSFIATICSALGIDPTKQNMSNVNRPIRIAEKGAEVLKEVLA